MVRSLCVTALEVRDRLEKSSSGPNPGTAPHPTKKVLTQSKPAKPLPSGHGQGSANSPAVLSSTSPIKRKLTLGEPSTASPHKRVRVDTPGGLVTSPEGDHSSLPRTPAAEGQTTHQTQPSGLFGHNSRKQSGPTAVPVSLFAKPPSARQPLLPSHMLEAFAQIQREEAANRVGSMRNWKGGAMSRGRVALV
jgi:transcription initiation protein SPT3